MYMPDDDSWDDITPRTFLEPKEFDRTCPLFKSTQLRRRRSVKPIFDPHQRYSATVKRGAAGNSTEPFLPRPLSGKPSMKSYMKNRSRALPILQDWVKRAPNIFIDE